MVCTLVSSVQVTVATSGTEQRLIAADTQGVVAVYISAPVGNTGVVSIGDSGVSTTEGAQIQKGTTLTINAPQGHFLDIYNMWVDVGTSGDKVSVSYLKKV